MLTDGLQKLCFPKCFDESWCHSETTNGCPDHPANEHLLLFKRYHWQDENTSSILWENKALTSKYLRNFQKSILRKQHNKKWAKALNRICSTKGGIGMGKHVKRCSFALVIRKMQIRSTIAYYLLSAQVQLKTVLERVERKKEAYVAAGYVKAPSYTGKHCFSEN